MSEVTQAALVAADDAEFESPAGRSRARYDSSLSLAGLDISSPDFDSTGTSEQVQALFAVCLPSWSAAAGMCAPLCVLRQSQGWHMASCSPFALRCAEKPCGRLDSKLRRKHQRGGGRRWPADCLLL